MVGRKYFRRSSFVDTSNQLSDMNPLKDEQKEGSHESDKKRRQQMTKAQYSEKREIRDKGNKSRGRKFVESTKNSSLINYDYHPIITFFQDY